MLKIFAQCPVLEPTVDLFFIPYLWKLMKYSDLTKRCFSKPTILFLMSYINSPLVEISSSKTD